MRAFVAGVLVAIIFVAAIFAETVFAATILAAATLASTTLAAEIKAAPDFFLGAKANLRISDLGEERFVQDTLAQRHILSR